MVQARNEHPDHVPGALANVPDVFHPTKPKAQSSQAISSTNETPTYNGRPITGPISKAVGNNDTPRYLHGVDLDTIESQRSTVERKLFWLSLTLTILGIFAHGLYWLYVQWDALLIRPFRRALGRERIFTNPSPTAALPRTGGDGTIDNPYAFVIIGSGYSGLGLGIRLKENDEHSFTIIEREPSVGGTWKVNRFPGAACDVPSHLYSFSAYPYAKWSHFWPYAAEIKSYIEDAARHFGLEKHIKFNTTVTGAVWDEQRAVYRVQTSNGDVYGRLLVNGQGLLSDPKIPKFNGIESYQGKVFHSQKWDPSVDLNGKRVAVIGCGASGVQIVPAIQKQAKHVVHFQRSAWWVRPRLGGGNFKISQKWQDRFEKFPVLQKLFRLAIYWSGEGLYPVFTKWRIWNSLLASESILYIYSVTKDPVLRRKLIPTFEFGCRRMLLSSEFYPALTQPNVDVVQSGLIRFTQDGVVDKDGVEWPVDVVILATGFHTQRHEARDTQIIDIRGRDGAKLRDVWAHTMTAYKGTTIPKFPNYFVMLGPNTNVAAISITYMGECQAVYILDTLREMRSRNLISVEPTQEAHDKWNTYVQSRLSSMVWQTGGCYSWYQDSASGFNTIMWPRFNFIYMFHTLQFDPKSYKLQAASGSSKNKQQQQLQQATQKLANATNGLQKTVNGAVRNGVHAVRSS